MIERLKDFMISVWDVAMLADESNYTSSIYRLEDSNWIEISLELKTLPNSVNYIIRDITSEAQQLVNYMHGHESIPFSLILLKRSKNISNTRDRFISIITACEIGVKEFYQQEKPDLTLIFENLSEMYQKLSFVSMFKGYFNIEFPKEIRNEIKNFIEKRNKLVHSPQGSKPTIEECFEYKEVVLKTFNFFYKINDSFMYRDFYEESIELTPTEPNKSQITLSKELERKVESQELAIGISITNVSTYKELYEAKSQDNKDFVENIDRHKKWRI
ncbi:hypothetical protein EfmGK941_14350 [Enterococcus faecium]|uniref:HEPN domain-containing protein n=1 Tax=Enterococcus faecium TaxID=1352 RepID=UPI002208ED90|nr:HEPN domain-containing protein [Enterococcus faecium]BDP94430.1 hypothetical protein EfmGK941_14350 [Enterococcus faecium]